ncbi:hypothetical protein [Shewanella sediminis]|uniref:hypothetical protein n=1 Tax=Shewanella sediminis TaxID=271097 RepID=UPI00031C6694|nr:hypothetical protein [Shewanella sediminis]
MTNFYENSDPLWESEDENGQAKQRSKRNKHRRRQESVQKRQYFEGLEGEYQEQKWQ